MLKALTDKIASVTDNNVCLIFCCVTVAGLSIPLAWFGMRRVSVMRWINPPTWHYIWTFTLICLTSYVAAGLVIAGIRFLRRASYIWLLVALLGSLVLAVVYKFEVYPGGDGALSPEMLFTLIGDALESALWLSVFTLPFSAAAYYVARATGRRLRSQGVN